MTCMGGTKSTDLFTERFPGATFLVGSIVGNFVCRQPGIWIVAHQPGESFSLFSEPFPAKRA